MCADVFSRAFPSQELQVLLEVRKAVAEFFEVPENKIHSNDDLRGDLAFDSLEPSFHFFVICRVLQFRQVVPSGFAFCGKQLANVGDLAKEVERILRDLAARASTSGSEEA